MKKMRCPAPAWWPWCLDWESWRMIAVALIFEVWMIGQAMAVVSVLRLF